MRYVAAFRTYTWDAGVAELARRFFAAFPSGRHVIFANEGKGRLGIEGYEVISHDDDTTDIGLPDFPQGNPHWYNVDYALYIIKRALPEYDYYVVSESDLAVNLPLEHILTDMRSRDLAMIVHEVLPSAEPWHWHANACASFAEPWRALCFFMAASAKAIDELYEVRLRHATEFQNGTRVEWPFCETFVPSTLKMLGAKMGQIGTYANTENLRFRPRLSLDDPRANQPGSMAHAVLPQEKFYAAVVGESYAKDWFFSETHLSQSLQGHNLLDYGDLLLGRLKRDHEHAAYQELRRRMSEAGAPAAPDLDLAFCKPAVTSSTCQWSNYPDPQRDAACANGERYFEDMAFHTAEEDGAWWMVDLLETYAVAEIDIVNRVSHADRFRQFGIESSVTGTAWSIRYIKLDFAEVSSDKDQPCRVTFAEPFAARYVRIRRLGRGPLHLRRVQIYGGGLVASQYR